MNKILGSIALAMVIAGPAMAADMPLKAPPPPAVFSWTGCYAGIQGGYVAGRSKHTFNGSTTGTGGGAFIPPFLPAGTDLTSWFNVNGELGGGEIGCNYQTGNWVWGVEADGSAVAASGQAAALTSALAAGTLTSGARFTTDERWLATARGRLGYAWDKWLWYITGGAAWTGVDIGFYQTALVATAGTSRVHRVGWVAGFGTEYAVAYSWSVKWETLYMDFGTFSANPACSVVCPGVDVRLTQWATRFGLNYKFDWYSPVVARH